MVALPPNLQARNSAIPQELKNLQQWACYIKGSRDKMPATPDEWTMKWGDRSNWLAFDEVSPYEKIGWFPTLENGILIADFDGCRNAETGEMHPLAQSYLEQLKHTYCELSQSKEGFKAYIRGTLPTDKPILNKDVPWKAPSGSGHEGIEIYAQKHFIAVTGSRLPSCTSEINPAPTVLNDLLTHFAKAPKVRGNPTPSPTTGSWDIDRWVNQHLEVIEKLADGYIVVCPWSHEHSSDHNTARIWSGSPHTFHCFHAHCDGREWRDVRLKYEPTAYDRREQWTTSNSAEEFLRQNREKPNNNQEEEEDNQEEQTCDNAVIEAKENGLPEFVIEGQLRTQVKKALEVLRTRNEKETRLFMYLSIVSKVEYNEKAEPIIMQLEKAALRNELSDAADFKIMKNGKNGPFPVDAHPPKDLAEQLLALAPRKWPLPPLKAIVETPVLRSDGSILDQPGYDQQTGLYYVPSPGMDGCKIPENPSKADAMEAMNRIKALFADFPFEGAADYANTIALLFTPFVRYAVKRDIQMALIDATNAGTGKGLITTVASFVATGRYTTPMGAKQSEEEWRKGVFSKLLQGPRIVIIDNIRGVLESATLELMLTGRGINDRILGHSKNVDAKNEATWMATGNNLKIGGDLPRRCYRIRLVSQTALPEERDDFAIKDLEQHVIDHRSGIISAILTVARAWYVAGKPQPINVPNLGTFTDWAKTIGGMLEFAGVEGFQTNRIELRSRNNEEALEWEAFLSTWLEEFGDGWLAAKQVADKIMEPEDSAPANPLRSALPRSLQKALADKPKRFATTLGEELGDRVQTVYGNDRLRVERDWDKHNKRWSWRVMRVLAGATPPHSNFEENRPHTPEPPSQPETSENLDGAIQHPQAPANEKTGPEPSIPQTSQSGSTSGSTTGIGQSASPPLAGGVKKFAGASENQSATYPVGRVPSEYLSLWTDYCETIRLSPLEEMEWRAPSAGMALPGATKKADHKEYTSKLLKSGDSYRVNGAVEAMKRTIEEGSK